MEEFGDNNKITLGSLMLSIDKRFIRGSSDTGPVVLAGLLVKYIAYAQSQFDLGNDEYYPLLQNLQHKLNNLMCRDVICPYTSPSTPMASTSFGQGLYADTYEGLYE